MLLHCTVHMLLLKTVSLRFSRMKLNGGRFWDGPIVFQRLHASSKPPTSILWYATFDIPTFWCDMRFEELWVTWPIPFLTRATRGLWGTESQITQHRLYNVPLSRFGFLPGLGMNENLQWPCEARFPWKNIRTQGAVGRITCKFTTATERKTRIAWENTRKVSLRGAGKQKECGSGRPHHMSIFNHLERKESGRVSATHVLVEKRYRIRERLAASHVNSQSLVNPRLILLEKTQGKWTQGMRQDSCEAHFLWKKTRNMWARSTASHVNLQSPWTQEALSLKKHMESGRVSATHVLVEKGYGNRERSVAYHINLQAHWTQDAFYPRKQKESGGVGTTRIFLEKHKELAGLAGATYEFTIKMKSTRNLYGIHNDFSGVGLRRGCILIRNRDRVE